MSKTDGKIWVLTGIDRTGRRVAMLGMDSRILIREEQEWVERMYTMVPRYHHSLQHRKYTYAAAALLGWWGPVPEYLLPLRLAASSTPLDKSNHRETMRRLEITRWPTGLCKSILDAGWTVAAKLRIILHRLTIGKRRSV